jgi:hypothetical protein
MRNELTGRDELLILPKERSGYFIREGTQNEREKYVKN